MGWSPPSVERAESAGRGDLKEIQILPLQLAFFFCLPACLPGPWPWRGRWAVCEVCAPPGECDWPKPDEDPVGCWPLPPGPSIALCNVRGEGPRRASLRLEGCGSTERGRGGASDDVGGSRNRAGGRQEAPVKQRPTIKDSEPPAHISKARIHVSTPSARACTTTTWRFLRWTGSD